MAHPVYVESLTRGHAAPTVKQHLAAVRMPFDYLVVGQVVEMNPAAAVRGPSYSAKQGKTPVPTEEEARHLIGRIDTSHVVGLRARALIAVMVYGFARVGAVVGMAVEDYYPQGKRWWFRLHEKGGELHELPAHHKVEEFLDACLDASGLHDEKRSPLFRTAVGKTRALSAKRMTRRDVYRMVRRRAADAGIATKIGCHTFRAPAITNYLEHGGTLEKAQAMANHESARTTKLTTAGTTSFRSTRSSELRSDGPRTPIPDSRPQALLRPRSRTGRGRHMRTSKIAPAR